MIVGHIGGGPVGTYTGDIGHSLRLRSAASTYLSRTLGTPSNAKKWALSMWVKRGALGTIQTLLGTGTVVGNMTALEFSASDQLQIYYPNTGANLYCLTSAVFRDTTSAIHIFVYHDPDNSTTTDRLQIWVNGVRQTFSTVTYPSAAVPINWAGNHQFGLHPVTGSQFDGYISRVAFIDNPSGVTASSFAYLNTETNAWVTKKESEVKAVVNAGGANSFMLEFKDATSLTTLGYDNSSKGNNWTCNNISLTAGPTYDHMLDVPWNSYATLNPLDAAVAPTNANLTLTVGAVERGARSSFSVPQDGLVYAECTVTSTTNASTISAAFGLATAAASLTTNPYSLSNAWNIYSGSLAHINRSGTTSASLGVTVTDGDVLRVAVDRANNRAWLGRNNTWYDSGTGTSGNPSAGTNPTVSSLPTDIFIFAECYGNTLNLNFGQRPFAYTPPTGFKALCQANLPDDETIETSGTFTGTLAADGPYRDIKGTPLTMTINGNAVTWGTHADKTAFGFKLRTASSSYNNTGSNTFSITSTGAKRKYSTGQGNP